MTIQQQITAAAARYGVSPDLALAVARRESGFNQAARGSSGEIGIFQLMPGTAADMGVNPYDTAQNIEGGVKYLSWLLDRYGNPETALRAYNGGPGNVDRNTVSSAAQRYAREVLAAVGGWFSPDPAPVVATAAPAPAPGSNYIPSFNFPAIEAPSWGNTESVSPWLLAAGVIGAVAAVHLAT